ncbi:PREDICTED: rho guanine nucleotide exchange factor 11-like [Priapulus caudatus]|uniref:Rho guanine nucleotide exchange factor 11-like n=1 Tax=Priapulus caudatus TaxID=37621 RepID=A0ABM1EPK4_PRICU|nr:PREDICTED: rho guanine nucleotide exchange factor 11-like [Priapulus caudatus]
MRARRQVIGGPLIQRCVIIQKDEKGYGLTVSGDNPVFVQSVKEGGAAAKAGVQIGDRIIKVNGTLVTSSNHLEVVRLVKAAGNHVALTLLGRPPGCKAPLPPPAQPHYNGGKMPLSHLERPSVRHGSSSSGSGKITSPLPVNGVTSPTSPDAETQQQQQPHQQFGDAALDRLRHGGRDGSDPRRNRMRPQSSIESTQSSVEWKATHTRQRSSPDVIANVVDDNATSPKQRKLDRDKELLRDEISDVAESPPSTPPPDYDEKMDECTEDQPTDKNSVLPPKIPPHLHHQQQQQQQVLQPTLQPLSPPAQLPGYADVSPRQVQVMSMEDDDFSAEPEPIDDHGPFNKLLTLKTKPAHLAVFLNYLISNSDPNPLLFYVITDVYMQGTVKDMKRWAYEIHSSFLVPDAPLRVNVETTVCTDIDNTLANHSDIESVMRSVFRQVRHIANCEVNEMLADFRTKRALGLGSLYGDSHLQENMDRSKELKIAEQVLLNHLEQLSDDFENQGDKIVALACALATLMRAIGCKGQNIEKIYEKVPQFCGPHKSRFRFSSKSSKNKVLYVKGHQFQQAHYTTVTNCQVCDRILWGIGFQGWKCDNCDFNLHKHCVDNIPYHEDCVGKKDKRKDDSKRKSTIVNIFRKPSTPNPSATHTSAAVMRAKTLYEEKEREAPIQEMPGGATRGPTLHADASSPEKDDVESGAEKEKPAQSYVERLRERFDSQPSKEREDSPMGTAAGDAGAPASPEVRRWVREYRKGGGYVSSWHEDGNLECNIDGLPSFVTELFHTERTHVRTLKVLLRVFYRPMLEDNVVPNDLVHLLFPNLEEMLELHGSFNTAMKAKKKEEPVVQDVGELMLSLFEGEAGDKFKKAGATFCMNQSIALDQLKAKMRSDKKVAQFIAEAESNTLCRRLQLKDLIPTGMQRLTKYPLLLDNIAKYTATSPSVEYDLVRKAQVRCRDILAYVNQAVRETENRARLADFQKRLDLSPLQRLDNPLAKEFRVSVPAAPLSLAPCASNRMITRVASAPAVLMQRDDSKYWLKFMSTNVVPARRHEFNHSPITSCQTSDAQRRPTDKKAFFLVSTSPAGPQIYELVAQTSSDRKAWVTYVTEAAAASGTNKQRPAPALPPKGTQQKPLPEANKEEPTSKPESEEAPSEEKSEAEEGAAAAEPSSQAEEGAKRKTNVSVQDIENIEYYQIIDYPRLISPAEVLVDDPSSRMMSRRHCLRYVVTLQAEPQLQHQDQLIRDALKKKQHIIAKILNIPEEEFEHIAEMAGEASGEDKEESELVLAAIAQAELLHNLINDSIPVEEQEVFEEGATSLTDEAVLPATVPSYKLLCIANSLNQFLRQLLPLQGCSRKEDKGGGSVVDRDKEMERMREQLKSMNAALAQHVPRDSRPNSYVSVASTVSELAGVEALGEVLHISSDDAAKEVLPVNRNLGIIVHPEMILGSVVIVP